MTITISPWLVWAVLSLALFGVVFWWRVARGWAGDVRAWWAAHRAAPLEDDRPEGVLCAGCAGDSHCDGVEGGCDCTCGWPEDWAGPLEELPPEQSAADLGFTGSDRHADDLMDGGGLWHGPYAPIRERRAPWWEAEHRAAYESLGFDYPSGLMARVRELTP